MCTATPAECTKDVPYHFKGMLMNKLTAVAVSVLLLSAATAQAQSIPGWKAYRAQQTGQQAAPAANAGQAPAAPPQATDPQPAALPQPAYQTAAAPYATRPAPKPAPNGGLFVGVQGGSGWVYEDVDQRAVAVSAGYRWQAGDYSQVGIELGAGRLDETTWRGYGIPEVKFNTIGANARFNFGNSPWFGVARLGYWHARSRDGWDRKVTADGAYGSLGVGGDLGRHFNLQLVYTGYTYAVDSYYDDDEYDINRADTVTLGAEVRF